MNFPQKIVIGADHAGFEYKEAIKIYLSTNKIDIIDVGTHSLESCDYPDYAHAAAHEIENGNVDFGILICGSAIGVSVTANKHQQIRCCVCGKMKLPNYRVNIIMRILFACLLDLLR